MPTPEIPSDQFIWLPDLTVQTNLRNQTNPTVPLEVFAARPTATSCNFNQDDTYDVNATQVTLPQEVIDDRWNLGPLLHIGFSCRANYESELNPDLKLEA